jgi:hypothetical protein
MFNIKTKGTSHNRTVYAAPSAGGFRSQSRNSPGAAVGVNQGNIPVRIKRAEFYPLPG